MLKNSRIVPCLALGSSLVIVLLARVLPRPCLAIPEHGRMDQLVADRHQSSGLSILRSVLSFAVSVRAVADLALIEESEQDTANGDLRRSGFLLGFEYWLKYSSVIISLSAIAYLGLRA